ncbi:hypothetical protein BDR05DRAFT_1031957 [Suillus weaverae]|nr:hypothetical protein BDR05DRAFT_1031957 [Suillus weaverae]
MQKQLKYQFIGILTAQPAISTAVSLQFDASPTSATCSIVERKPPGSTEQAHPEASTNLDPFSRMLDQIEDERRNALTPAEFPATIVQVEPKTGHVERGKASGLSRCRLPASVIPGPVNRWENIHQLEEDTPKPPAKKQRIEPDLSNLDHPDNNSHRHISPDVQRIRNILASRVPNVQEVKQGSLITSATLNSVLSVEQHYHWYRTRDVTTASDWRSTSNYLAQAYLASRSPIEYMNLKPTEIISTLCSMHMSLHLTLKSQGDQKAGGLMP